MSYSRVLGTGSYIPSKMYTNEDLATFVDTNDEWIYTRTGIKERHISTGESTLDLAYNASIKAIEKSNIDKHTIDLIIVATVTSDYMFPGVSNLLQARLGIENVTAFDMNAACSGFIYAIQVADKMIKSGAFNRALVVGAETLSRLTDWSDRNTCVLFGDGAGALVLSKSEDVGVMDVITGSQGDKDFLLYCHNPKLKNPEVNEISPQDHIHMKGREVFKYATKIMPYVIKELLTRNDLALEDIKAFIPHQANQRIIDKAVKDFNIDKDKIFVNISKYGNTSAASVAIALDEAIQNNFIKKGDLFLTVAFGGGLTWAGALIQL